MLTAGTVPSFRVSDWTNLALASGLAILVGWGVWLALYEPLTQYERTGAAMLMAAATLGLAAAAMAWSLRLRSRARTSLAQETADRMSCFHVVMSQTNRLILRRPEPAELFAEVCKVCVAAGHAEIAVIDLVDGEVTTRVASTFAEARDADMSITLSELHDAPAMRQHLVQLALESGEPVVINDTGNDARLSPWQDHCLQSGVNSLAVIPLKRGGEPVGILLLCSSTAEFFVECLIPLLSEMGADLSFALDNSDRERARRDALEQTTRSHQLFQTLFAAAPVPMAIVGLADHQVVKVNALWSSLAGLAPGTDARMGSSFEGPACGLELADRSTFYEKLRSSQRVVGMQTRLRSSSGECHDVLVHAHMVDYLGERSFLVVATDVSDLKAAQVADNARAVAEGANRAKTDFLSRMSHELRTPLNAILGFAQLLGSDTNPMLSPTQSERVDLMTKAGWHLLDLVNDVMDISSIESGRVEVLSEPHDISTVLDEAVALCQPLAKAHRVELHQRVPFAPAIGAMTDPRRLRQVLINLISNACKYNRPGGTVRVDVHTGAGTDVGATGNEVVVEVVDNGIGMTAEQMSHLFEPFNRLGNAEHETEGTGIGLTLSRQLVEGMKGRLGVTSSTSRGTCVRLVLPACDLSRPKPAAVSAGPVLNLEGGSSSVLYIEDNEVNRIVVEQMMTRCKGVTLMEAQTGADGLAFALQKQPDLILLDMQLPDMSGFEVLKALRADPRTRGLRVVAVSASAMPQDVEMAMGLGVLDYWTKPLEMETLFAGITTILQLHSQGANTGPTHKPVAGSSVAQRIPTTPGDIANTIAWRRRTA
jgi:signal transduction histidine kinase/ActR/RegA family two-component response regulator